jgi:hypothetical protein
MRSLNLSFKNDSIKFKLCMHIVVSSATQLIDEVQTILSSGLCALTFYDRTR